MKTTLKTLKPMLLTFFVMLSILSCNKSELFEAPVADVIIDNPADTPAEDTTPIVNSTEPCDFTLDAVQSGDTVIITCLMDLGGQTINLPSNVTIVYEGGDIINGTLNFSNGIISGELLNATLTISGSGAQVKDPVFNFIPSRWGIVEGEVQQPVAFNNHLILQNIIDQIIEMGITTFSIDKLDAYFDSVERNTPIMELPSDFHLKMSENTHLRIYPVDKIYASRMIRIRNKSNVTISGGFIHGERDEHGPTAPFDGTLIWIMSGIDILVENVHISNSSLTGLTINSYRFSSDPLYDPSRNVVVRGCVFDSNRSNNISVTDGKNIIIEDCKLYRAGLNTNYSLGAAPRIGIVIEPVTGQKVEGVIIRNNILKEGAGKADILAALGSDILITGNEADLPVGWTLASNVRVINNPALRGGVSGGDTSTYGLSQSRDNEISGNTIIGAPTGIQSTADDVKIYNNKLIDCKVSIMLRELTDSEIYGNTITSDVSGSFGINAQGYLNNVLISNNNINLTDGRSIFMSGINSNPEFSNFKFTIKNNVFETYRNASIVRTSGMEITDNIFSVTGISFLDSENINFNNNKVTSNSFCLKIEKDISTKNINIIGNEFESSNSAKLGGYGIKMSYIGSDGALEDTNFLLQNNKIKVLGSNYGIHVQNLDGITIRENEGEVENYEFIYFRGNNSTIINNTIISGFNEIDVVGINNTVYNNN